MGVLREKGNNMYEKILTWASGLAPRLLILVLTLGALGGVMYLDKDTPFMIGAIVISGSWAQWMNMKVKNKGGK